MQTRSGARIRFQRSDNQPGLKGRQTDYQMITFSSIKASVELKGIYQPDNNIQ
ncbi:hypothetical protein ACU62W_21140 [Klebsiella aerogenes]|nr:hypothetical protein [Klebsiella aerogenes]HEP1066601.1 hypothetical protein [Klebsiella aerogenes]